jgi:hypothetical protein
MCAGPFFCWRQKKPGAEQQNVSRVARNDTVAGTSVSCWSLRRHWHTCAMSLRIGDTMQREVSGEDLLAIVADKFVAGHTNLLGEGVAGEILEPEKAGHNMVLAFSCSTG